MDLTHPTTCEKYLFALFVPYWLLVGLKEFRFTNKIGEANRRVTRYLVCKQSVLERQAQ